MATAVAGTKSRMTVIHHIFGAKRCHKRPEGRVQDLRRLVDGFKGSRCCQNPTRRRLDDQAISAERGPSLLAPFRFLRVHR